VVCVKARTLGRDHATGREVSMLRAGRTRLSRRLAAFLLPACRHKLPLHTTFQVHIGRALPSHPPIFSTLDRTGRSINLKDGWVVGVATGGVRATVTGWLSYITLVPSSSLLAAPALSGGCRSKEKYGPIFETARRFSASLPGHSSEFVMAGGGWVHDQVRFGTRTAAEAIQGRFFPAQSRNTTSTAGQPRLVMLSHVPLASLGGGQTPFPSLPSPRVVLSSLPS